MIHTSTEPPSAEAKLDLRFVSDAWSTMNWPPFLRPFRFAHRFEVIQDTFVEGNPDLHVDRALWRRLAAYMALEGRVHRVLVVPDLLAAGFPDRGLGAQLANLLPGASARTLARIEGQGVPLADFLSSDGPDEEDDWDPPDAVFVLDDRTIRLAMTAERYYQAGGPDLHHDSATYAFHARRDISGAAIAFLQLSPEASRWNFDMLVSLADPV